MANDMKMPWTVRVVLGSFAVKVPPDVPDSFLIMITANFLTPVGKR